MAGMVGYNPYSDASGAIGGGGDILGSTILRGALMRQAQAQKQQQLMMELMRMKMEQEHGENTKRYQEGELKLGQGRLDIEKKKQDATDEELGMRKKFGASMRMQGVPELPEDYGAPTLKGVKEYQRQKTMADQNEATAFLSNEPKNAFDTILRMQALRQQPLEGNPALAQIILSGGLGLHNIPPGNTAVAPGGAVAGQGIPQRPVGRTSPPMLSPNVLPPLLEKLLDKFTSPELADKDPTYHRYKSMFEQALAERFGTNTPAMTIPPDKNSARSEARQLIQQHPDKKSAIEQRFQQTYNEAL